MLVNNPYLDRLSSIIRQLVVYFNKAKQTNNTMAHLNAVSTKSYSQNCTQIWTQQHQQTLGYKIVQ